MSAGEVSALAGRLAQGVVEPLKRLFVAKEEIIDLMGVELVTEYSAFLTWMFTVLNERRFRRVRETRELPLLMVVGSSNRLPDDEALEALFDRFMLRASCTSAGDERIVQVLEAGWQLDL